MAPATISRLRQKKLDPFQSQSTSKNFNHMSHAKIVTGDTRNISKAWLTTKSFQSHFFRQYRDYMYRHSQHFQTWVVFNSISRVNIMTSGTLNISKRWSTSKYFNHISRANIVTSDTRNISKGWSTSKNFQSHFSRHFVTSDTRNISKAWSTSKNF